MPRDTSLGFDQGLGENPWHSWVAASCLVIACRVELASQLERLPHDPALRSTLRRIQRAAEVHVDIASHHRSVREPNAYRDDGRSLQIPERYRELSHGGDVAPPVAGVATERGTLSQVRLTPRHAPTVGFLLKSSPGNVTTNLSSHGAGHAVVVVQPERPTAASAAHTATSKRRLENDPTFTSRRLRARQESALRAPRSASGSARLWTPPSRAARALPRARRPRGAPPP